MKDKLFLIGLALILSGILITCAESDFAKADAYCFVPGTGDVVLEYRTRMVTTEQVVLVDGKPTITRCTFK